ncbi:MAG: HNH endonuclease [Thermodesulfovibrionales bacterium]
MDFFIPQATDKEMRREKDKARALRKTQWWKRKCAEGTCYYCGRKVEAAELTMDHIVPLIRGGKSTKGNTVPACKTCNSKKKHMLPMEWDDYLQRARRERTEE